MAKVAVKLVHEAALSTDEVDSLPPGQAHWWLRKESDFIRLPKRVRGDEALDLVVQLEPGDYVLGVGPARGGVREDIEVKPDLAKGTAETPPAKTGAKAAKIDVTGKSFVITGDLDSLDRDAAKAWLVSLGAKVTSGVTSKTDFLLVGREPGPKKLEKAAELGTTVISEAELRASLGEAPASAPAAQPQVVTPQKANRVSKLVAQLNLDERPDPKVEQLVGPSHFADLGMLDNELWGIAIGPRGGHYNVYIKLNDRPQYGIKCSCRDRNPCKHGYALLLTADRNFVPPVAPPEGHEESCYYESIFE